MSVKMTYDRQNIARVSRNIQNIMREILYLYCIFTYLLYHLSASSDYYACTKRMKIVIILFNFMHWRWHYTPGIISIYASSNPECQYYPHIRRLNFDQFGIENERLCITLQHSWHITAGEYQVHWCPYIFQFVLGIGTIQNPFRVSRAPII